MALTDNILAYWKLDNDGSGGVSLVDSTGNNYTLTNNGNVSISNGLFVDAANFNGSTGTYLQTVSDNFNVGAGDISISIWINPSDYGTGGFADFAGSIFDFANRTGGSEVEWLGIFNSSGYLRIWQGAVTYTTTITIPLNTWTNIVITRKLNITYVYINGKLNGSFVDNALFNSNIFTLGYAQDRAGNGTLAYNGLIDEVGVWARALTANEIYNLYYNGQGNNYPFTKPVMQLPFNGWDADTNTYYIDGEATTLGQNGSGVWRDIYYYNGYPITLPDPSTVALGTTYGYNNQLTGTMTGTNEINIAQLLGLPPFITI